MAIIKTIELSGWEPDFKKQLSAVVAKHGEVNIRTTRHLEDNRDAGLWVEADIQITEPDTKISDYLKDIGLPKRQQS